MKKRLMQSEEFDLMKMILDKFLWFGLAFISYGLYLLVMQVQDPNIRAFSFIILGAIIIINFVILLIKEYEVEKWA